MFGPDVDKQILARAKETDEEICGVIVDGKPVFLENVSDSPKDSFLIREIPEGTQAVFHSHPGGPFYPSKVDIQQQYAMVLPWAIACYSSRHSEVIWFGEDVPKKPLIGRPFIHGISDCYTLIQDFYEEVHGIKLMNVPRDWEWWDEGDKGDNLYLAKFKEAGFHEVESKDILPGDAFIATIGSKVPNHAGIYLGNGLILHHLGTRTGFDPYRLSVVEPIARWTRFITKVVRHEDSNIDRTAGQGIWPQV